MDGAKGVEAYRFKSSSKPIGSLPKEASSIAFYQATDRVLEIRPKAEGEKQVVVLLPRLLKAISMWPLATLKEALNCPFPKWQEIWPPHQRIPLKGAVTIREWIPAALGCWVFCCCWRSLPCLESEKNHENSIFPSLFGRLDPRNGVQA